MIDVWVDAADRPRRVVTTSSTDMGGVFGTHRSVSTTEYFDYSEKRWLPMNEVQQTWEWWGLYPTMVLMQDGRLFYTQLYLNVPR